MPSDPTLARQIYDACHLEGEFLLRSGTVSHEYFDKYLFESDPALLRAIAEQLATWVPEDIDALAGLELGGIPVATALALRTGVPVVFVRKAAKEYGTRRLAEGGEIAGKRLLVVEDVVTSAGQIVASVKELRALGAQVDAAICVIDREAGGHARLAEIAIELRALFTITELAAAAGRRESPAERAR